MMRELELRCCCDPSRLLGYLQVSGDELHAGARLHFPIRPAHAVSADSYVPITRREEIVLEVQWLRLPWTEYLAVKSNDTPIEQLRELPGFREAPCST